MRFARYLKILKVRIAVYVSKALSNKKKETLLLNRFGQMTCSGTCSAQALEGNLSRTFTF